MKKAILITFLVMIVVYSMHSYAVSPDKAKQGFSEKKPAAKKKMQQPKASKGKSAKAAKVAEPKLDDPIKRQYLEEINDPNKLSYPDPGNVIPTPHTKQQYIAKLINEMTIKLNSLELDRGNRADLQKRIQALREIKKGLN